MQCINHGIPAVFVVLISRRQEDDDVPVDGVPLQVALQCRTVDLDVLDRDRFCALDHRRNLCLHLGRQP
jgi:hypothetical protein